MADEEHLKILRQGVDVWNEWRRKNPELLPNLLGADLNLMNLSGMKLSRANLNAANFTSQTSTGRTSARLTSVGRTSAAVY
jgi:uncharacterized protein YjbI with pentapeptide repeats